MTRVEDQWCQHERLVYSYSLRFCTICIQYILDYLSNQSYMCIYIPNSWMVYNGKSILKWMIWGYPYFRKLPYQVFVSFDSIAMLNNQRVYIHKMVKVFHRRLMTTILYHISIFHIIIYPYFLLPSGNLLQFAIENDHRHSGFSHWKWWIFAQFHIVGVFFGEAGDQHSHNKHRRLMTITVTITTI